jgi:predicted enzyme related to lactoylglutathione lyase
MANAVVQFEFGAADDGLLVAFYSDLFGWKLQGLPDAGYTLIDTQAGDGINGGIARSETGEPWSLFYVETDDLQATLDRANALGGKTAMPVTGFGGGVARATFTDPDGLLVGLVQAAAGSAQGAGPGPSAGSGEAATWFEVMGSEAARTQQFYADLFGWKVDQSFPAYAAVDTDAGRGIAGGLGGGTGTRWAIVYAHVPSVVKTLSQVERLGGSLITDETVPRLKAAARGVLYGSVDDPMKTAAFHDPAGNVFGVYDYGTG